MVYVYFLIGFGTVVLFLTMMLLILTVMNGCKVCTDWSNSGRKPEDNPSVFIVGSRDQRAAARVAARARTPSTSGRMTPPLGMHTPPPAYSVVWPGDDPRLHGPDSYAPPSYSEAMGTSPDVRVV